MVLLRRFLILLLLMCCLPVNAYGSEAADSGKRPVLTAQVYTQSTPATLADVLDMPEENWQTTDAGSINFGYSAAFHWVRLPLSQLEPGLLQNPWIVQLGYPLLDHIELFVLDPQRSVLLRVEAGNNLPFSKRPLPVPEFAFPMPALSQADYLYLNVYSQSSVQIPVRIYSEQKYWQQRASYVSFAGAFYAILLCMMAYNLLIWMLSRDRLFLLYSLGIGFFTLMMANLHGWTYALLWPESPKFNDLAILLSIALTAIFLALFGMDFLRLKKLHPRINRLLWFFIILAGVMAALSFVLTYSISIRMMTAMAIALCMTALGMGMILWLETRSRDVFLFFLAAIALLCGLFLYALQKFGVLPVNMVTEHAGELGGIALVILLALGIAERHNRERQARIAAQDVIIRMQRETNSLLDQRVRERTEDLELLNKRLQEESTTDALTRVRNRRYFDQKLFSLYQDAYRQQEPISLLLIDIDHFKQFNDTWGHSLGDLVLQKAAQAMQQAVKRPLDAVYRYGGEEFAILLPDTNAEGARQIAELVRKRIAALRLDHQGQSLGITASIGLCSVIPARRNEEQLLCEHADKALYQAKAEGRNRVCLHPFPELPV